MGLVLSFGADAFVYTALKNALPILGFIRFPIKYVVLVVFALPLLAALGIASLKEPDKGKALKRSPFATISIVMLAVSRLIVLVAWFVPVGGASAVTTAKSGVTRIVFLAVVIGALIWLYKQTEPLPQDLEWSRYWR